MRMSCGIILVAAVSAAGAATVFADVSDPRVRTYVNPVRIVWQTPESAVGAGLAEVKDSAVLLEKRRGQAGGVRVASDAAS